MFQAPEGREGVSLTPSSECLRNSRRYTVLNVPGLRLEYHGSGRRLCRAVTRACLSYLGHHVTCVDNDRLSEKVLGAVFEVSNTLGAGFLEKVYA